MWFTITKLASQFLTVVGFYWVGSVFFSLWLLKRKHWREGVLGLLFASLFWVLSVTTVPARLLSSLEAPFAGVNPAKLPAVDAIVMLGGTIEVSPAEARGFNFVSTVDRLLTAVDLMRLGKGKALVIGGGGVENPQPEVRESTLLKTFVTNWGVVTGKVHALPACRNTRDEAVETAALAQTNGWKRIYVVSSANHLKRAVAIFKKVGLDAVGVGCDFEADSLIASEREPRLAPDERRLHLLHSWLHETVGWYYYRLRGWI